MSAMGEPALAEALTEALIRTAASDWLGTRLELAALHQNKGSKQIPCIFQGVWVQPFNMTALSPASNKWRTFEGKQMSRDRRVVPKTFDCFSSSRMIMRSAVNGEMWEVLEND